MQVCRIVVAGPGLLGKNRKEESSYHLSNGKGKMPEGLSGDISSLFVNLVETHWILPRGTVKIECVHGDNKFYLMAEVPLAVKGKFRWKPTGVVAGSRKGLYIALPGAR